MTTTTASSTPTKGSDPLWSTVRKEVHKEIMNTDILCEIAFPEGQEALAVEHLERAFAMMREFESRYSRFKEGNELWQFNHSDHAVLSGEFFDMLTRAADFHKRTGGLFDPSILPALEEEGYRGAPYKHGTSGQRHFSELHLDPDTLTATKPADLLIDLGGIGKGYIVDQVSSFLAQHFENFLVDAGGDIYTKGTNQKEHYPYWAIEVEHPEPGKAPVALLLLTDMAVATSGRNRRHWMKHNEQKHHIIDPRSGKSAEPDFLSVTVIAPSAVEADVFAKTLFIAGREQGPLLAEEWGVPALFVESSGKSIINNRAEKYVWKA